MGATLDRFLPMHTQPQVSDGNAIPSLGVRLGHPVLKFAVGDRTFFASVVDSDYNNDGMAVKLFWVAQGGFVAGVSTWSLAFERHVCGVSRMGYFGSGVGDSFTASSTKVVSGSVPSIDGTIVCTSTEWTVAELNGLAAHESYRLSIARAADTLAGQAHIFAIEVTNRT